MASKLYRNMFKNDWIDPQKIELDEDLWPEPSADELELLDKQLAESFGTDDGLVLSVDEYMAPPPWYVDQSDTLPTSALIDPSFSYERFNEQLPMLYDLVQDPVRKNRAIAEGFLTPQSVAQIQAGKVPPELFFHATRANFGQFDNMYGDVGSHIGSRDQAADRLRQTETFGPTGTEKMIPLLARTKKPLHSPDAGVWENSIASLDMLSRRPDIPERLGKILDELQVDAETLREDYAFPDEWIASNENKEILADLRQALQDEGYDAIDYINEAEGMKGAMLPPVAQQDSQLRRAMNRLDDKYMGERPEPPDMTGLSAEEADDLIQEWSISPESDRAPPTPFDDWDPDDQKLYNQYRHERADLKANPESYSREYSRIMLDPEDMRSPTAEFMPEGQQDMSKPGLLRSLAGPAALGGGMAALFGQSEEAEAANNPFGWHFSKSDDVLRRLDPEAYGSGASARQGAERSRLTDAPDIAPRSYFYAEGANPQAGRVTPRPEGVVGAGPTYRGKLRNVYDLAENPMGFTGSATDIERQIKEAGFGGYDNNGVMVSFEPTEVERVGGFRAEAEENLERLGRIADEPNIVTAEAIPSTQTEMGRLMTGQPLDVRERYTDDVWNLFGETARDLGVEDYFIRPGYGSYRGGVNPNLLFDVNTPEEAKAIADTMGYATQQDAVPYFNRTGEGPLGVNLRTEGGATPELLGKLNRETGLDATRTLLDSVDIINFDDMPDEEFIDTIDRFISGRGVEGVTEYRANANYNETAPLWQDEAGLSQLSTGQREAARQLRSRVEALDRKYRKQYGRADPRLLGALAAIPAVGAATYPLFSSPEEIQAGMQGDALRTMANLAEAGVRDIGGIVTGAVTNDPEMWDRISEERSLAPSGGIEALGNLVGETARGIAPAVSEGLQRAREAAYDPVTEILEYSGLGETPIGSQIETGVDAFGSGWDWLGEQIGDTRRNALGLLGLEAMPLPGRKIDPRYSPRRAGPETRALEGGQYEVPEAAIEHRSDLIDVPELEVEDLEGESFVTSLYDRTRGEGSIVGIHGEPLAKPVDMQGGNEFSLWHPGTVGASNQNPVTQVMNRAREAREATGKDPLFLTFNMAPTGADFSTMPGELMISRMQSTLSKPQMRALDKEIRNLTATKGGREVFMGIKDWPGLENTDEAFRAWEKAPGDVRKEIANKVLDKARGETGFSQTDARLLSTAPDRLNAEDLSVQATVGRIKPYDETPQTRHRSYPVGIPGEPVGRLPEGAFSILDLIPSLQGKQVPHRAAMAPMRGEFDELLMNILTGNK